jgi:hypothetical protein
VPACVRACTRTCASARMWTDPIDNAQQATGSLQQTLTLSIKHMIWVYPPHRSSLKAVCEKMVQLSAAYEELEAMFMRIDSNNSGLIDRCGAVVTQLQTLLPGNFNVISVTGNKEAVNVDLFPHPDFFP